MNSEMNKPKVLKESKNKIRVEFERTSALERAKQKYLSLNFLAQVIFAIFRYALLLGVSYVILYPFVTKIASSFMSPEDFVDVTVKLIPKAPTLNTYKQIIIENQYGTAMLNTFLLSLSCGLIQTFITCLIGYGFAKYKFKGSKLLFAMVMLTMIVPHQTLKLSMFMQFRHFDFFGLLGLLGMKPIQLTNTYWPLIILSLGGLAFKNGLYIFLMRQFFRGVPDELEESAYIDGSGTFRTYMQIILPLSIPMMVTVFLFAFCWQWTDNFYVDLFFTSRSEILLSKSTFIAIPKTLDVDYAGGTLFSAAIRNTCAILIIIPLIIVYLFGQNFLVQGIERSGITG